MPLTESEALLRVALLVARCDGRQVADEERVAAQVLGMGKDAAAVLAAEASRDLHALGEHGVLAQVAEALPSRPQRMEALELACRVAGADHLLAQSEASQLQRIRESLGLGARDVARVVGHV